MQVNLSKEEVERICLKYFQTKINLNYNRKFEIKEFSLSPLSSVPIGFLANHNILNVKVNFVDQSSWIQITFFVKYLPKHSTKQTEYIEGFCAFEKEIMVYKKLIPDALEIGKAAIQWAPQCYLNRPNDLLILDDLRAAGYQMSPGTNGILDVQHLIAALEAVATLHVASIVIEKQTNRKMIDLHPDCLYENAYPLDDRLKIRKLGFENAIYVLGELISKISKYSKRMEEILPKFKNQMTKIFDYCQPSRKFRNVACHADLWKNNILFRYAEFRDGVNRDHRLPIEAILVDFQLARYAPPALDVLTLITITTDGDFRSRHLQSLLDTYYDHLRDELHQHQINLEMEIPRRKFNESCRYFEMAGLIESCLFSHLTLLPKELSVPLVSNSDNFGDFILHKSRLDLCWKAFDMDSNYRYRMTDMLCEFIDRFVLK